PATRAISGLTAGLQHLLSTLQGPCRQEPGKTRFRPAGSPLPGGCRTRWIVTKGFRLHDLSPFQGLSWRYFDKLSMRGVFGDLMPQDLAEEELGPVGLRVVEEVHRIVLLDDLAAVHEDDAVRHGAGEAHLMSDADHGHPGAGELDHHIQHFLDH